MEIVLPQKLICKMNAVLKICFTVLQIVLPLDPHKPYSLLLSNSQLYKTKLIRKMNAVLKICFIVLQIVLPSDPFHQEMTSPTHCYSVIHSSIKQSTMQNESLMFLICWTRQIVLLLDHFYKEEMTIQTLFMSPSQSYYCHKQNYRGSQVNYS